MTSGTAIVCLSKEFKSKRKIESLINETKEILSCTASTNYDSIKRLRADSIGKFLSTNNGSESVSIARADGKSLMVVAEGILVNPQLLRDVDERKKLKLIIKRRIFRENFL